MEDFDYDVFIARHKQDVVFSIQHFILEKKELS